MQRSGTEWAYRLAREPQPEALDEAWDRVGLHLMPVALGERGSGLRLHTSGATELDQLAEGLLEACRRDDLQKARGRVAGVPEGVPLVAGLEDQVAGLANHHLVSEQCELTHEIFTVGGGRYARFFIGMNDGWVKPGGGPATVEEIAAHIGEIRDPAKYTIPYGVGDELRVTAKLFSGK